MGLTLSIPLQLLRVPWSLGRHCLRRLQVSFRLKAGLLKLTISFSDFLKAAIGGYYGEENVIPTNKSVIANRYEEILETFYDQMAPITARKP